MSQTLFHTTLVTLFPEMFPGPLGHSLAGQARELGIWNYKALQLRDFAHNKHRSVDDTPYGGGAGMVLRPEVVDAALEAALAEASQALPEPPRLLYMSARGRLLTQTGVKSLVNHKNIVILCGRFEGVDQRVLDARGAEEVSMGDYVLSGGEIAALALMDACIRLLPGVMGDAASAREESFSTEDGPEGGFSGLLEYPHFTRPADWEGRKVPEVLLSGNHAEIAKWRRREAEAVTRERRPDLLKGK